MSEVFRLHVRPKGGKQDGALSFSYCRQRNILGMGWGVGTVTGQELDWDAYKRLAEFANPKGLPSVRMLRDRVSVGDLIWTRDTDGSYYIAKVREPWRYLDGGSKGQEADIYNFVACEMHRVRPGDVPGKVIACFRPPRTFQPIVDETIQRYSWRLWADLTGEPQKLPASLADGDPLDLFALLDDQMTEDLVALWLQDQGWQVIPSTAKLYTMRYEFVMVHGRSGAEAVVEVKTGASPIDVRYDEEFGKVFVFQPQSCFVGTPTKNVSIIESDELLEFAHQHVECLPGSLRRWVDIHR